MTTEQTLRNELLEMSRERDEAVAEVTRLRRVAAAQASARCDVVERAIQDSLTRPGGTWRDTARLIVERLAASPTEGAQDG